MQLHLASYLVRVGASTRYVMIIYGVIGAVLAVVYHPHYYLFGLTQWSITAVVGMPPCPELLLVLDYPFAYSLYTHLFGPPCGSGFLLVLVFRA